MAIFLTTRMWRLMALGCAAAMVFATGIPQASELEKKEDWHMIAPWKARFSFHSARLEFRQTVAVQEQAGSKNVEFVIPEAAKNLEISIPGESIARWTTIPVLLAPSSNALSASERTQLEKDALVANLEAVKARIAVWESQTSAAEAQELKARQNMMEQEMPGLVRQREELQRQLNVVERQLAMLPERNRLATKVVATLAAAYRSGGTLEISYAYDLDNCGWLPRYDFNAITTDSKNYRVKVRMLAEVWQYGGMDWNGTEITLASQGSGPREPLPLQKWVVGEKQPQPRVYEMKQRPLMAGAMNNAADAAPVTESATGIVADTASVYAAWILPEKGLPEGKSRIAILEDEWQAPLQWLARPTESNNRVWLYALCELPVERAWPAGAAQFAIDGQNVGSGAFTPREGEVALYFGADPRVNVATTVNTNKRGQTGFINTNKTWTGAWTYTISNRHDEAVKVKVERPAPMPTNEEIKVSYKDTPPATVDDKRHMVYWEVETPAHGKAVIDHSVTITSPEDLSISPNVP